MSIARLRRVLEAIKDRKALVFRSEASLVEWQTKVLASFIGAISQDAKQSAALQKQASKLSLTDLLDGGKADMSNDDQAQQAEDDYSYIETGSRVAADRNRQGTAEMLMHLAGR